MSGPPQVKGRKAEDALWDRHRTRIEHLYIDGNRTLSALREIMATEYDFDRSPAQYERVFRKWNIRKNLKAKESKSINHRITKREAQGKKSDIRVHGCTIKIDKSVIEKRASRHNFESTLERFQKAIQGPQSPASLPDFTVSTPVAVDEWFLPTINLPWSRFAQYFSQNVLHAPIASWGAALQRAVIPYPSFADHNETETSLASDDYKRRQGQCRKMRALIPEIPDNEAKVNVERAFGLTSTSSTAHLDVLKLAIYMLSNNLDKDEEEDVGIGERVVELCQSQSNLVFLKRLLEQKQYTIQAMAEKLLPFALHANDEPLTRILLDAGVDPNTAPLITHLTTVIAMGHTRLAYLLIEKGANINTEGPLSWSIRKGDLTLARLLLSRGANVDGVDEDWFPGLFHAIINGNVEAARLLLEHDAAYPVDLRKFRIGERRAGTMPYYLDEAAKTGSIQMVKLLLEHDRSKPGWYIVAEEICHCLPASVFSGNVELVKCLLSLGVDMDATSFFEVRGSSRIWEAQTAIQVAADKNDKTIIRLLLEFGANPNATGKGLTALQNASLKGNLDVVTLLLQYGANVNAKSRAYLTTDNFDSWMTLTALQGAVLSGNDAIVNALLMAGASANEAPGSKTALQIAVEAQSMDLVKLLISYGADVNAPAARSIRGVTALTAALKSADLQMTQYLLSLGANVNNPTKEHSAPSPLQVSIECFGFDMMVELLHRGADVSDSGALWAAVRREDSKTVRFLLDHNSHLEDRRDYGRAALVQAVWKENVELVRMLVEAGVELNGPPMQQFEEEEHTFNSCDDRYICLSSNAIFAAVLSMNIVIVRILSDGGADINGAQCVCKRIFPSRGEEKSYLGSPMPFIDKSKANKLEMVRLLLDYGAKIDERAPFEYKSFTLLQMAVEVGDFGLVRCLLDSGADIDAPPSKDYGRTALQVAAEVDSVEMVESLLTQNASVNAAPAFKSGATALQFAALNGNFKIVRLLLNAGADINAPRGEAWGRTALEGAAEHGHLDMVRFLLDYGAQVDGTYHQQYCRAIQLARKGGHGVLAKMLEAYRRDRYPDSEWEVTGKFHDIPFSYDLDSEDETDTTGDSDVEDEFESEGGSDVEVDSESEQDPRPEQNSEFNKTASTMDDIEIPEVSGVYSANEVDEPSELDTLMDYDYYHPLVELPDEDLSGERDWYA